MLHRSVLDQQDARAATRYSRKKRRRKLVRLVEAEQWTFWVTQTFRGPEGSARPRVLLDWYCALVLADRLLNVRALFVTAERHRSGALHLHMLWRCSDHSFDDWRLIKKHLFSTFGIARVYPCRTQGATRTVIRYATKYALKGSRKGMWRWRKVRQW